MQDTLTYVESFLAPLSPAAAELTRRLADRRDIQPSVGPHVGAMLGWLIRLARAKRVLELGTCAGYGAVWMGEALRETGGQLVSVEYREDLVAEARANVQKATLGSVVTVVHGDAAQVIEQYDDETFDLIVQDADKALYPRMLDTCVRHVRRGGILAADDALFPAMKVPETMQRPIAEYNKIVFSDSRLTSTLVPIGDGLLISVRR